MKINTNRSIQLFLILIILFLGFFFYKKNKSYSNLQIAFEQEKKELTQELDKLVEDYDEITAKKVAVSSRFRQARKKIYELRDSLNNLSEENYSLIRKFRKRVTFLEKENKLLSKTIDSLYIENNQLTTENDAVKNALAQNEKQQKVLSKKYSSLKSSNTTLQSENENLSKKIAKAQQLDIKQLEVIPLKKRNSGKFTSTSRSRKAEAIKISMHILENEVASSGKKKIHIQIVDENKRVINPQGNTEIKGGRTITYTAVYNPDYNNNGISFVTVYGFEKGTLKRGKYLINVYLDYQLVGNKLISLR